MTFLLIKSWLRVVNGFRRFNCLGVTLKDPTLPPLRRHFGDVFLGSFTSALSVRRTCAPQHRIGVLSVGRHIGHIRLATILIEAIDSLLEVSFVLFISSW